MLAMVVTWVSPNNNGLVRGPGNASFNPVVQVDADAGVALPVVVPVSFDGGTWQLTRANATLPAQYGNATVTLTASLAGGDGTKAFIAGWPDSGVAGLTATRTVTWDATGPRFAVRVEGAPGRPNGAWGNPTTWRKDERVQVEVGSSEALSGPATLTANASGAAVTTRGAGARCPAVGSGACPDARCDCFEVDLAGVPLNAVSGQVGLVASGQDVVGNAGQDAGPTVAVTRVRWQATTGGTGATAVVEPALDTAGNVYVGYTTAADAAGVVKRLDRDGAQVWAQTNFGAVTAPVVWSPTANPDGGAGLFVATRVAGPSSEIRALDGTTGLQVGNAGTCFNAATYSARMVSLGRTVVTARETSGQQQAYLADPGAGGCIPNGTVLVTGKATVVGRGGFGTTAEVYIASAGSLGFNKLTTNGTNTNWMGMTDSLGAGNLTSGLALAPGPSTRAFQTVAGTGIQGVVAHNLVVSSPSSQPAFTSGAALAWTTASLGVPMGGAYDVYFGTPAGTSSGDLYKTRFTPGMPVGTFTPNDQTSARVAAFDAVSNSFTPAHQPILGGGGAVLTVSTQGDFSVFTTAGVRQWTAPGAATGFGAVSVSAALDVSRSSTGQPQCGRPGTLYVLSNTGAVTAFIVDAPGLERGAAWPRFQHDNANSGNADMSNDAWSCP